MSTAKIKWIATRRAEQRAGNDRDSDAGDTLVEVLLALVVLALAGLSLIIAFQTSISASADGRRLATANIVLDGTSQEAVSSIESDLSLFQSCPTTYSSQLLSFQTAASLQVEPAKYQSMGYTASITSLQYWDNASGSPYYDQFAPTGTCYPGTPVEITVEVTDPNGNDYLNTFVVDYPLTSSISNNNTGTGTSLVWANEPSTSANSGSPLPTQPVLDVEDVNGQLVTNDYSPVLLSIQSGTGATLQSCSGSESSGVVTFSDCTLTYNSGTTTGGPYTLVATDGTLTSPVSTSITLSGATLPYFVFSTEPSAVEGNSGSPFTTYPVVEVYENGIPDTSWAGGAINLTASGGILSGCTGTSAPISANKYTYDIAGCTFEGGYIYDPVSKTNNAVPYELYASVTSGAATSATSTPFTVAGAGSASQLVFSTQPSGVAAGIAKTAFTIQPAVTVEDAFGNVVTSYSSSISMSISAGETLSGCSSVTPTNGVAQFSGCEGNAYAQNVTLTATSGSLSVTSAVFSITGLPSSLTYTTQPVAGVSGGTLAVEPVLKIVDSNGYLVTSEQTPITLTVSGGTLAQCTGLTPVGGIVNVETCSFAGTVGTEYTMTAELNTTQTSTGSPLSVTSSQFAPTGPGVATQLVFTTEPVAAASQSAFSTQPVIKVEDSAGNIVVTSAVQLSSLTTSGGTLSGCSNFTAVTGVINLSGCTFEGLVGAQYTMTASSGTLTPAVSTNFSPTGPGPATQILLTGCSTSIVWNTSCTATATLEDVVGNVETAYGGSLTFALASSAGGQVTGFSTVSAPVGVASDTLTGSNIGTLQVDATGDGLTSSPITILVTPAPQSASFYTSNTYQTPTTTGSATYFPSGTYQTYAQGGELGTITFASSTTSVCTIGSSSGTITIVSAGTCNVTATAAAIGNYAASPAATFTLTINKAAAPTVTAANQTLTYSGTNAVVDTSTVSGLQGSDAATVSTATYTYAGINPTVYASSTTRPTNVGTYSVTPSAATLNFTAGATGDYNSPYNYVAGTLTINQAAAPTVTAANQTLTYDGTNAATDTSTVSGLQGSNSATASAVTYTYVGTGGTTYASSTTAPINVGTYSVTPSAATLTFTPTTASGDYNAPNYVAGTLTINRDSLTVTANNQTVTYDGTNAVADGSAVSGQDGSDVITVASATYTYVGTGTTHYTSSTTIPTNAGTYSVTPSAAMLTFSPTTASNDYNAPTYVAGTLTINQAQLTVTANNQTATYDGIRAVADGSTVTGQEGTDGVTVASATYKYAGISPTIYTSSTTIPTNAGTYSVTPSAASLTFNPTSASGDYATTYVAGTLTINQAQLTVTANNQTATYDGTNVVADGSTVTGQDGTDRVTVASATYTYAGINPTIYTSSTTRPTNVGTYSVTPSAASLTFNPTSASGDYNTPTYVAGTLTINPVQLTVLANSQTLAYTGTNAVADTSIVSGLQGTDAATVSTATYTYSGTTGTTYASSQTPPTAAGYYNETPSAATITFTNGLSTNYNTTYTYGAGGLAIYQVTNLASNTSTSATVPSGTLTGPTVSGDTEIVVVYYADSAVDTCSANVTGTSVNTSSLVDTTINPVIDEHGGSTYYQMCVYQANGTGGTGGITATLSGTPTSASIDVLQVAGDTASKVVTSQVEPNSGHSNSATFELSSATSGDYEIGLGISAATWTTPSGYTVPVGATGTNASYSYVAYVGSVTTAFSATLSGTNYWGAVGLDIEP